MRYGDCDIGYLVALAAARDPELVDAVERATGERPASHDAAVEAADAICDRLGITAEARGEMEYLLGARSTAGCSRYLMSPQGEVLRERLEGERPGPCGLGCGAGRCLFGREPSPRLAKILREWWLCGGLARMTWPRAGGLEDQDSATVWWFEHIDELVRARPAKE